MLRDLKSLICESDEVMVAKKNGTPIIALESTIITHGMPYPDNFTTALEAETFIRNCGCAPATIAVLNGKIKIGLTKAELEYLSRSLKVQKLSTNNLSMSVAQNKTGSTTVAATLILTSLAKIAVFATGGIGGAHRGSEKSFDISADLKQLSSSPLNVVCAGPKAILDIPKTVEILETLGIPLITYKNKNIPAFWSSDSGLKSPIVVQTVQEIVDSYIVRIVMGLKSAQLICNPIPIEHEISKKTIEPLINKAIAIADVKKITGKDLTPFLLSEILKSTSRKSLKSNKALLFNNIDLATKIAKTLKKSDFKL